MIYPPLKVIIINSIENHEKNRQYRRRPAAVRQGRGGKPAGHVDLSTHFEDIDDPRVERTKKHKLFDIIVLSI